MLVAAHIRAHCLVVLNCNDSRADLIRRVGKIELLRGGDTEK